MNNITSVSCPLNTSITPNDYEFVCELAKEFIKAYRGKLNRDHLIEEMADVLIMIEQVMNIYDIKDIEVIMAMRNKLDRTNERLKEGNL